MINSFTISMMIISALVGFLINFIVEAFRRPKYIAAMRAFQGQLDNLTARLDDLCRSLNLNIDKKDKAEAQNDGNSDAEKKPSNLVVQYKFLPFEQKTILRRFVAKRESALDLSPGDIRLIEELALRGYLIILRATTHRVRCIINPDFHKWLISQYD